MLCSSLGLSAIRVPMGYFEVLTRWRSSLVLKYSQTFLSYYLHYFEVKFYVLFFLLLQFDLEDFQFFSAGMYLSILFAIFSQTKKLLLMSCSQSPLNKRLFCFILSSFWPISLTESFSGIIAGTKLKYWSCSNQKLAPFSFFMITTVLVFLFVILIDFF